MLRGSWIFRCFDLSPDWVGLDRERAAGLLLFEALLKLDPQDDGALRGGLAATGDSELSLRGRWKTGEAGTTFAAEGRGLAGSPAAAWHVELGGLCRSGDPPGHGPAPCLVGTMRTIGAAFPFLAPGRSAAFVAVPRPPSELLPESGRRSAFAP